MGVVVAFRPRIDAAESEDENEIDLVTAVDVAIRDLREIKAKWGEESALRQAEACLTMLERAFEGGGSA